MVKKHLTASALVWLALTAGSFGNAGRTLGDRPGEVPSEFLRTWSGQQDTLEGLEGIHVAVAFNGGAGKLGLSSEELKARVERRLQQSGVPIVAKEKYEGAPVFTRNVDGFVAQGYKAMKAAKYLTPTTDYGYLLCTVCATGTEFPIAVDVRLGMSQSGLLPATLPEQIMLSPCITWLDSILGAYDEKIVKERIVSCLDQLTDRFSKDYLATDRKTKEQKTNGGEAFYQHDMDIARLRDLRSLGGMIERYRSRNGAYPLQDGSTIPTIVYIATREQRGSIQGAPPYTHKVVAVRQFIQALREGLGDPVELPFDPQRVAVNRPNFYEYMVVGDTYFLAVHTHEAFGFARKVSAHYCKVEVSNKPIPSRKVWEYRTLMDDECFVAAASRRPHRPGYIERLRTRLRATNPF